MEQEVNSGKESLDSSVWYKEESFHNSDVSDSSVGSYKGGKWKYEPLHRPRGPSEDEEYKEETKEKPKKRETSEPENEPMGKY